jgi:hypothetical protein
VIDLVSLEHLHLLVDIGELDGLLLLLVLGRPGFWHIIRVLILVVCVYVLRALLDLVHLVLVLVAYLDGSQV